MKEAQVGSVLESYRRFVVLTPGSSLKRSGDRRDGRYHGRLYRTLSGAKAYARPGDRVLVVRVDVTVIGERDDCGETEVDDMG